MKDSFYNTRRVLQTNGDVLWIDQFAGNISSNNEQIIEGLDQYRKDSCIY